MTEVAEHTGFPEMLDGRVKTLHPTIHGGLLARRDSAEHMAAIEAHGIATIDLLVVNLYPFEATVAKAGCTLADAIENIDIGGPAMVRSAAKNWNDVAVLTDASQYAGVVAELKQRRQGQRGDALRARRRRLRPHRPVRRRDQRLPVVAGRPERRRPRAPASSRRRRTAASSSCRTCATARTRTSAPRSIATSRPRPGSLVTARQLQGKELSYNNIADADAAWECVKSFAAPACVIVKHANPCGVAVADDCATAYAKALKTDPTSAFGGIIAFNGEVDRACAEHVAKQFVEVLIAPSYSAEALAVFAKKANVRVLQIDLPAAGAGRNAHDLKRVGSGLLIQTADNQRCRRERPQGRHARASRRRRRQRTCCSPGRSRASSRATRSSSAPTA